MIYTLLLVFCINYAYAIDSYPDWFLFPHKYTGSIIGFSYGNSSAINDAKVMYCLYKKCLVSGALYTYNDYDYRDSDYFYDYSSDCVTKIQGRMKLIDGFVTNLILDENISLFSLDSLIEIEPEYLTANSLKQPEWSKKTTWQETDYYYGVGMYSISMNENDAWKTAEERAIFEIMNMISIDFYNVKILTESIDDSLEEVNALRVNYYIRDIEVRERWPDIINKQAYVLVRIPTDKITPINK